MVVVILVKLVHGALASWFQCRQRRVQIAVDVYGGDSGRGLEHTLSGKTPVECAIYGKR